MKNLRLSVAFYCKVTGRSQPRGAAAYVYALLNPSLRAAFLFQLAASSDGVAHLLVRNLLLAMHSCDVAKGAQVTGPIFLPHPLGIVIGAGSVIEAETHLYQNVTIGQKNGAYPTIRRGAVLFPGCVIVGDIDVGEAAVVGANAFVDCPVDPGEVFRGAKTHDDRQSTDRWSN